MAATGKRDGVPPRGAGFTSGDERTDDSDEKAADEPPAVLV
jgi:hypothetical protein